MRLGDLRGRTVGVECEPCRRRGVYLVARLIEAHGSERALADLLLILSRSCRHQRRQGSPPPHNEYARACRASLVLEAGESSPSHEREGFIHPLSYPPYRIETWDARDNLLREIALLTDLPLARRVLKLAAETFTDDKITVRQRARIIMKRGDEP